MPEKTEKIKLVAIVGPTGVGKTSLSIELALRFNGEIISADSMQVHRHMDIATAKPTREEKTLVRHHLIDIVEPDRDYNAADFVRDAQSAIRDITGRGKSVFIVGGTGLYLRALLGGLFEGPGRDVTLRGELMEKARTEGRQSLHEELKTVDPVSAGRIHPNNINRLVRALEVYYLSRRPLSEHHAEHGFKQSNYDSLVIGLNMDRAALYERTDKRVEAMVRDGLLDETRGLLKLGFSPDLKSMRSLGYREMIEFIQGLATFDESVEALKKVTRNYAKRQITWFKKENGIRWFAPDDKTGIIAAIKEAGFKETDFEHRAKSGAVNGS